MMNFFRRFFTKKNITEEMDYSGVFESSDALITELAQGLVSVIPIDWKSIHFYAEVFEHSYSIYYSAYEKDSTRFCDYGELKSKENRFLFDIVKRLHNVSASELNSNWSVLTLEIADSGKFNIDFSYDSLEETDEFQRRKDWKKKNLPHLAN